MSSSTPGYETGTLIWLDPDCVVVGRVVHPVDDMQWDEFIYCAYALAVETQMALNIY